MTTVKTLIENRTAVWADILQVASRIEKYGTMRCAQALG